MAQFALSEIQSVFSFDESCLLRHGTRINDVHSLHLGDFYKVNDPAFLDPCFAKQCWHNGCKRTIGGVLDLWRQSGSRCELHGRHGNQKHVKNVVVLQLPNALIQLILKGGLRHIAAPMKSNFKFDHLKAFLGPGLPDFRTPVANIAATDKSIIHVQPRFFRAASEIIRGQMMADDDNLEQLSEETVLAWLDEMEKHSGGGLMHLMELTRSASIKGKSYNLEMLVLCVRAAGLLRQDKQLKESLAIAGQLLNMPQTWLADDAPIPTKSCVSRNRFMLDCAYCLMWRQLLHSYLEQGLDFKLFAKADSSPRAGLEWLYMEFLLVLSGDLQRFNDAMHEIIRLRGFQGDHSKRLCELAAVMKKCIKHHILVPVGLGAKHMSLANKWSGLLHSFRLIAWCWQAVGAILSKVAALCTDLGVESQLQEVPLFDPNVVLPGWDETKVMEQEPMGADDVLTLPGSQLVGFPNALRVVGEEHNLHTIQEHVTSKMPSFKKWYTDAK